MARRTALLRRIYSVDNYQSLWVLVPVGVTRVKIFTSRENWPTLPGDWPDNLVIKVDLWQRAGPGQVVTYVGGFGSAGGPALDRDGNPVPESETTLSVGDAENPLREIQIVAEVRAQLTTAVDFDDGL